MTTKKIIPFFSLAAFEVIRKTVGALPAETGGMLIGNRKTGVIKFFHFDGKAECSSVTYSPNAKKLNKLLTKLNASGLDMMGFVHSHPSGFLMPSGGDRFYCGKFFEANPELPYLVN